jgi:hypothetical protein
MKKLFTLILFIVPLFIQAQNWLVRGKVTDKDSKPIAFASVFINNTTIGTQSDENGNFKISIPPKFKHIDLVASFVGFIPQKINIDREDSDDKAFKFVLENVSLGEVNVKAKMDKDWKRHWNTFYEGLMGETDYVKDCRLLNPEVVQLAYDEATKTVTATASQPLIIENDAFGLKITYQLVKLDSDGKKTFVVGNSFFEYKYDVNEKIKARQQKNFKRAYQDSFRSFLVAVSQNKLKESGFEVYKMNRMKQFYEGKVFLSNEVNEGAITPTTAQEICSWDRETEQYFLHSEYPLLIFALNRFDRNVMLFPDKPFKFSQLNLPKVYLTFSETGWINTPNSMLMYYFWGKEGLANQLPDDYEPDEILSKTKEELEIQPIKPKEEVVVAVNKTTPTQEIEYNKNETFKIADDTPKGVNALVPLDYQVKITEKDYSNSIFELLRKIPGLQVRFDGASGSWKISFLGSMNFQGTATTPALLLDGQLTDNSATVIDRLRSINVSEIKRLGAVKHGNSAGFGSRGGNGVIIVELK